VAGTLVGSKKGKTVNYAGRREENLLHRDKDNIERKARKLKLFGVDPPKWGDCVGWGGGCRSFYAGRFPHTRKMSHGGGLGFLSSIGTGLRKKKKQKKKKKTKKKRHKKQKTNNPKTVQHQPGIWEQ